MAPGTNSIDATLTHARAHFARGEFAEALKALQSAGQSSIQKNPEALYELGRTQIQLNQFDGAMKNLASARRLAPGAWQAPVEMSKCLQAQGKFNQALTMTEEALRLRPGHPEALARKAEILRILARRDEAYELLAPIVRNQEVRLETLTPALVLARVCLPLGRASEGIDIIERALRLENAPAILRSQLLYQLAALHNAAGDYEKAWIALTQANELAGGAWDPKESTKATQAIIESWSAETIRSLPLSRCADERPVFIIGMPRSGSTLIEQILSRHPQIEARGELTLLAQEVAPMRDASSPHAHFIPADQVTQQALDRAARKYVRKLCEGAGKAQRVTDKTLLHFQMLGLITRLLPNGRIIHCTRDPLDTCISCYFQGFGGALHFTNDLYALGRRYRDYQELMQHWEQTLEQPMHDASYEAFVEDPEGQTRALIEFLDLPWDDACLDPAASDRVAQTASLDQVRQPIYKSSVRRSERFSEHLEPLRCGLEGRDDPRGN